MQIAALALVLATATTSRVDVRFVPDEARSVLSILDTRAAGQPVADAQWQRLFTSEGYVRLKQREHSMHRAFEDDTFRTFVLSDELLAHRAQLARTLDAWLAADLRDAANRALAYLPANATIRAKVYPVIKPATNSFVFETDSDPAIFMYVGTDIPREEFEATIAHEMHHIGYGTACAHAAGDLPPNLAKLQTWISALGEGFAALAAAGGPDGIPQRRPDVAEEWRKQMSHLAANFEAISAFYDDILSGRLSGDAADKRGFELFGKVGPWYTAGWSMGSVIERTFGRDALIAAMCDQTTLIDTYNRAVAKSGANLPRFPERIARAFLRQ